MSENIFDEVLEPKEKTVLEKMVSEVTNAELLEVVKTRSEYDANKKVYKESPAIVQLPEVEALQFVGDTDNLCALGEMGLDPVIVDYSVKGNPFLKIGTYWAGIGDYVIKDSNGNFRCCDAKTFKEIYTEV